MIDGLNDFLIALRKIGEAHFAARRWWVEVNADGIQTDMDEWERDGEWLLMYSTRLMLVHVSTLRGRVGAHTPEIEFDNWRWPEMDYDRFGRYVGEEK